MLSFSFPCFLKKKKNQTNKSRKLFVIFHNLPDFCGYELVLELSTRSGGDLSIFSLHSSAFLFLHEYGFRNNPRQANGLLRIYLGIAHVRSCYYSSMVVFVMVILNSCFPTWMVQMEFKTHLVSLCSMS